MIRIGLTGNVASGKTAVADLWRAWGATVIDADVLAREAVAPGTPGLAAVVARFGAGTLQADGTIDRAALRRRVMGDAAEREALHAIVHPEVQRLRVRSEAAARAAGVRMVVHDIPLLFEVLDPAAFDAVVLVDAPAALRRDRLVRLRGLPPQEADALIAAQAPSGPKRARSTYVIENDGSLADLEARALAVWGELQVRAASA